MITDAHNAHTTRRLHDQPQPFPPASLLQSHALELAAHYVNAPMRQAAGGRRHAACSRRELFATCCHFVVVVIVVATLVIVVAVVVIIVIVLHFTDIVVPSIKGLFYAYISKRAAAQRAAQPDQNQNQNERHPV